MISYFLCLSRLKRMANRTFLAGCKGRACCTRCVFTQLERGLKCRKRRKGRCSERRDAPGVNRVIALRSFSRLSALHDSQALKWGTHRGTRQHKFFTPAYPASSMPYLPFFFCLEEVNQNKAPTVIAREPGEEGVECSVLTLGDHKEISTRLVSY